MILWYECQECSRMTASSGTKNPVCDDCRARRASENLVQFNEWVAARLRSMANHPSNPLRASDGLIHGRPQPGWTASGTDRPSSPFRTRRWTDHDGNQPCSGGLPSLGKGY